MLTLRSGEASLVLAPETGGAIVGWTLGAALLLRRPSPEAVLRGDVRGMGCFPLMPFSNRIADGCFRWNGVDHMLRRNFGDHPHAIHGVGWQRAWQVAMVGSTAVSLALRHDAIGEQAQSWPFAFAAEQHIALNAETLTVRLSLTNLHSDPAPCGIGLHPYFPRAGGAALRFTAQQVWRNAANALPSVLEPVPPDWDHTGQRPIGSAALDNCFAGWDGQACITWADGVTLDIEAGGLFRHLVVYTPPARDFFCVEPVSHMNDAINRMANQPDNGLRVLAPGEAMRGSVVFRVGSAW